ncbi:MAG: EAL and modified HD-GYP domain-containing signal transduction protein [Oleiphilaceae bacterium]|jgi:EAL and modified HD-GYP domain-containing signal transduction protein
MEKQDILLARQPIYDRNKTIVGYELLFRENNSIPLSEFDGNRATSRVLLSLFTETDLASVTGGLPAFVNFTAELLNSTPIFNPQAIIIEVLEDIEITDQVIANLKTLKKQGYTLALDDFIMDERYEPILELVDIIKLELPEMNDQQLIETINSLKKYNVKLLAEKIETQAEFNRCKELGCDMFQGYFLSKPEIIKGKKIEAGKLSVIGLISEIQDPNVDMPSLTKIITKDPVLSFKLLKLINSAAFKRANTIESIHKAITLLGIDKIKSWVSLLALSKLDDKPESLHYLALVRALMCEKLAEYISPYEKDKFYTVGLLSCLDAFFDQKIEEVVRNIKLDSVISAALLSNQGDAGLALETTLNFEQSHWHKLNWNKLSQYNLNVKIISIIYYECSTLALSLQQD